MNAPTLPARFNGFDLDAWRSGNRRRRLFGLREEPMPPISGEMAMRLLQRAYDATHEPGGPSIAEYRREVDAIQAARDTKPRNPVVTALLARDGSDCWLCGDPLGDDITKEHRVPRSRGGSDDLSNLVLAHAACNRLLGNAPAHLKDAVKTSRGAAVDMRERKA